MKVRIRKSAGKRVKRTGFRARSKTHGGRNIIKRKRRRSGGYRVG